MADSVLAHGGVLEAVAHRFEGVQADEDAQFVVGGDDVLAGWWGRVVDAIYTLVRCAAAVDRFVFHQPEQMRCVLSGGEESVVAVEN